MSRLFVLCSTVRCRYDRPVHILMLDGVSLRRQGREKRDRSVEQLRLALNKDYVGLDRKWILLFPEGGFLKNRKEVSQR